MKFLSLELRDDVLQSYPAKNTSSFGRSPYSYCLRSTRFTVNFPYKKGEKGDVWEKIEAFAHRFLAKPEVEHYGVFLFQCRGNEEEGYSSLKVNTYREMKRVEDKDESKTVESFLAQEGIQFDKSVF